MAYHDDPGGDAAVNLLEIVHHKPAPSPSMITVSPQQVYARTSQPASLSRRLVQTSIRHETWHARYRRRTATGATRHRRAAQWRSG